MDEKQRTRADVREKLLVLLTKGSTTETLDDFMRALDDYVDTRVEERLVEPSRSEGW